MRIRSVRLLSATQQVQANLKVLRPDKKKKEGKRGRENKREERGISQEKGREENERE